MTTVTGKKQVPADGQRGTGSPSAGEGPEKLRQKQSLDVCGWGNPAITSVICETGR